MPRSTVTSTTDCVCAPGVEETGFDWSPVLARSLGWITAHADGRIIGFVNVAWDGGGHMFLLDTTVDPAYQRRGIGSGLVHRAIELSVQARGDWLHVNSDESLMRDFYLPCGFRPTPAGLVNLHEVRQPQRRACTEERRPS